MDKQLRHTVVLVGTYFLAYIVLGMTTATLGPSLPYLAENVGTSLKGISSLFIAHRLGYMAGSFGGGRLYDRVRGNRLMAAVLLIMVAGMLTVPVVPILAVLIAILFLLGTAEGAVDVGGNILLVWTRPPRIGSLMNALHLFFGLGALISPLILVQMIRRTGGIRWGYWLVAALIVPIALILLPQESPQPGPAPEEGGARRGRLLLPLLIAVFFFLHVAAESSYGAWIYTYSLTRKLADQVSAGYLTSAFWGAFTLGRLGTIFLALRINAKRQLGGSVAGAFLSLVILLIWGESTAAVWIATIAYGVSLAGLFPGSITLASENLHLTGGVTGFFLVGSSLGAMTVPWLIGQFFESVGPHVFPLFLAAAVAGSILLLAAILVLLRMRR
ncbi:MAG: MFS transporter [Spirochaetales bacterium]|nr:MFS transporter [Spirochaetales bacterium]